MSRFGVFEFVLVLISYSEYSSIPIFICYLQILFFLCVSLCPLWLIFYTTESTELLLNYFYFLLTQFVQLLYDALFTQVYFFLIISVL